MTKPKISLCICVWNTSHLLERSMHTYANQDFPMEDWELIIIDDNSLDDVRSVVEPFDDRVNIRYVRLEHDYGMRGNTFAFNTAFKLSQADIIAETTAETMFQPSIVRRMYEEHRNRERAFIAFKTYNLTHELQLKIDDADWKSDIMNISKLEGWDNPWTQNNVKNINFGTHQTCSIKKDVFFDITGGKGFPLYGDYGSEDPMYAGLRESKGIQGVTIMDVMPIHQWHPPFGFWQAKGMAPNLNKFAHSTSNYMNDTSGEVPEGGTCQIWDGGSHEQLSEEEIKSHESWNEIVKKTGCKIIKL